MIDVILAEFPQIHLLHESRNLVINLYKGMYTSVQIILVTTVTGMHASAGISLD